MDQTGLTVAKMWHEILMNSSTSDDVHKYPELMDRSPAEIQIILMAGTRPNLLLRDYVEALHIPKSTLTSMVNRLEDQHFLKRTISTLDRRSYGLELDKKGVDFLKSYMSYQNDIGTRIINGLNSEETEQLVALLNKISSYMVRR